jgi:hypothetical protein
MSGGSGKYSSKDDCEHSYRYSDPEGNSIIYRYELKLIDSIKVKSRTQEAISRRLGLNVCIVHELIDGLLLNGHIQQNRKRKLFFWHRDLFSATLEGMTMLERAKRNDGKNRNSLKKILFMVHSPTASRQQG